MVVLNGKKLSERILNNIKKKINEKQLKLKLAVVSVGENIVSKSFIKKKEEACRKTGIDFELFNFSSDINETELKEKIKKLAEDKNISGIVIQLPLPKTLNTQEILNLIPEEKDIDILSEAAINKWTRGLVHGSKKKKEILPPVVGAIKRLLEEYKITIKNKKIILIGKGKLVGEPLTVWLKNQGLDFSVIDRRVKDIGAFTKEADIIISGAGSPALIKENMVKEGAVLIDAGSSLEEGLVRGDIDKNCYKKASFVAPVPGGVGPMTIACLLENLIRINIK